MAGVWVHGRDQVVYMTGVRFEPAAGRLWRGGEELSVRPKTAAVLALLVGQAGELVTKGELLASVWPDGFVGEAVLAVCVNELRQLLGDDRRAPRFIATVPRRGYRLVAQVAQEPLPSDAQRLFVGRVDTLAVLEEQWAQALTGRRGIGFVAAQAGVGKTALVEEFASRVRAQGSVVVGWGQCVEQFGAGEPYLPILQVLAGLCRETGGAVIVDILRQSAPSWCAQLGMLDEGARPVADGSGERMLREFAVAVEALTARRPLLVVLEDLHDADRATTEMINYLARRRERARLLLVGSYRPAELIARGHPLRPVIQDLRARRLCRHLSLELLSEAEVSSYLAARLAPRFPAAELSDDVYERSEGNALFMVAITEVLFDQGLLVPDDAGVRAQGALATLGIPDDVRQMLERHVEALDERDRRLLSVAAAAGMEFAAEIVRAGMVSSAPQPSGDSELVEIEERCDALAARQAVLVGAGGAEWPDGTVSARYRFVHQMYREVLYERLTPARRAHVHRRIGERLASGYGHRAVEVAADLAVHFERSGDWVAAGTHLTVAATTALGRSAYPEARAGIGRALELMDRVSDPAARDHLELSARAVLLHSAAARWDWLDAEVAANCLRLGSLAREQQDTPALIAALLGLHNHARGHGDVPTIAACVAELDALAAERSDRTAHLVHHLLHMFDDFRADRCVATWEHARALLELSRSIEDRFVELLVGTPFNVAAHLFAVLALWELGCPDQAREHAAQAVSIARTFDIPAVLARALYLAARVRLECGEAERALALTAELGRLCADHDLGLWRALSAVLEGFATGQLGDPAAGLDAVRRSMADYPELLSQTGSFHLRVLAGLCLAAGDTPAGLAAAQDGLDVAARTGEAKDEVELWRLRGELLVQRQGSGDVEEAERCLGRAVELAAGRKALSWQLRAATSLAGLWHHLGRASEARALLGDTFTAFTEGYDTADLVRAKGLLEALVGAGPPVERS